MRRLLLAVALCAAPLYALTSSQVADALGAGSVISRVAFTPAGYGASGLCFLPNGKLLVVDAVENQLVEMSPDGTDQTVFASNLQTPRAVAVDAVHGYVYVADQGEYGVSGSAAIVRFNLDGSGEQSFTTDGTNQLGVPTQVSVDASGDVLVVANNDYNVGEIRELSFNFTTGALESISLIGPSTSQANLSAPSSIAISPVGDTYIAEYAGLYVRPSGSTNWVQLNYPPNQPTPTALAFSNGDLLVSTYVQDGVLNDPRLVSYPVIGGGAAQTLGTPTILDDLNPDQIAVAPSGISEVSEGTLFLTDAVAVPQGAGSTYVSAVQEVNADGSGLATIALGGSSVPHFDAVGYDAYSHQLLVADATLGTITSMNTDGSGQRILVTGYGQATAMPYAIAASPTTGDIVVAASGNSLKEYPPSGGSFALGSPIGSSPLGATSLFATPSALYLASSQSVVTWPWSGTSFRTIQSTPLQTQVITVDGHGTVYDAYGYGTSSGLEAFPSTPNGPVTKLTYLATSQPTSIALDRSGRLFVSTSGGVAVEVSTEGLEPLPLLPGGGSLALATGPAGQLFDAAGTTLQSVAIPPIGTVSSSGPASVVEGARATLTVRGSDLGGSTAVILHDADHTYAAKAANVTTTSLTTTVPMATVAGTYEVEVEGPGGLTLAIAAARLVVLSDLPVIGSLSPATGATTGGRVVTIKGTFLSGATSVHFGSAVVTGKRILSDTPTKLRARTPAHKAGKVQVYVVTKAGRSAAASFKFT